MDNESTSRGLGILDTSTTGSQLHHRANVAVALTEFATAIQALAVVHFRFQLNKCKRVRLGQVDNEANNTSTPQRTNTLSDQEL